MSTPTTLSIPICSILFNGAQSVGAGIAACKNMRVREEEGLDAASKDAEGTFKTFSCTGIEALGFALLGTDISGSMCDKLISRELLGDVRFREGVLYEDALLASRLFPKCDNVFCDHEAHVLLLEVLWERYDETV